MRGRVGQEWPSRAEGLQQRAITDATLQAESMGADAILIPNSIKRVTAIAAVIGDAREPPAGIVAICCMLGIPYMLHGGKGAAAVQVLAIRYTEET